VHADAPTPVVLSYDVRERKTAVETSPTCARDCLLAVIEMLKEVLGTVALETPITLHAVTPFPATMQTTLGREVSDFVCLLSFSQPLIFFM
jgi:hypothetical protein